MPKTHRCPEQRHQQIIRQWRVLQRMAAWRRGVTLADLQDVAESAGAHVSSRTLRRDLEALTLAGFAIVAKRDVCGATRWLLEEIVEVADLAARRSDGRAKTTMRVLAFQPRQDGGTPQPVDEFRSKVDRLRSLRPGYVQVVERLLDDVLNEVTPH